jgi:hypothetical protein
MSLPAITLEQEHFNAARRFQEYYDNALSKIGGRAPAPILGQTVDDYRRETCRLFKRTFLPPKHEFYEVQWRGLPDDTLQVLEPQLMRACLDEANNPKNVDPGEFRKIEDRNPYGQVQMMKFVGQESFVKNPAYGHRPGRRVTIRNPDTSPGWFPREVPSPLLSGRLTMTAA